MKSFFATILLVASIAAPNIASASEIPDPWPFPQPPSVVFPGISISPVGPRVCDARGCYQRYCVGRVCFNADSPGPIIRDDDKQQN